MEVNKKYFVTGIGNAVVDILAFVDDSLLKKNKFAKGSSSLIDRKEAPKLTDFQSIKYEKIHSGGSVANSICTLASLNKNIKTAFIGRVGDDKYGKIFDEDLKRSNVYFHSKNRTHSGLTAKSFILITPDGKRTMRTFLESASDIGDEIEISVADKVLIANSSILYLEGYLWDKVDIIRYLRDAINVAISNQTIVALNLSDSSCAKRHRNDFLRLLTSIDIIFSNENEIKSLMNVDAINLKEVSNLLRLGNTTLVMTLNDKGAIIFDRDNFYEITSTNKITNPLDMTGARDCFIAGFLYGLTKNYSLKRSAEIGNIIASNIIQKLGARFEEYEIEKLVNLFNPDQSLEPPIISAKT